MCIRDRLQADSSLQKMAELANKTFVYILLARELLLLQKNLYGEFASLKGQAKDFNKLDEKNKEKMLQVLELNFEHLTIKGQNAEEIDTIFGSYYHLFSENSGADVNIKGKDSFKVLIELRKALLTMESLENIRLLYDRQNIGQRHQEVVSKIANKVMAIYTLSLIHI
eukprot:TRINITY_DN2123_c0_g1_i8.p1 TRINITY_DN2123_c0_g1~~TRINITY_DN2123_c0_g1_i8.p1  ORF type:complete len:168 (+),score=41.76 TRINITY_DN2123_c0_g1_i8:66-569(+)